MRVGPICGGFAVVATLMLIASSVNLTHFRDRPEEISIARVMRPANLAARALHRVQSDPQLSGTVPGGPGVPGVPGTPGAPGASPNGEGTASAATPLAGCLITKWASIWVVHAANGTRSHVQFPTEDCDLRALEVPDDNLDRYPKAHGGIGLYSLSKDRSTEACALKSCGGKVEPEPVAPPKPLVGASEGGKVYAEPTAANPLRQPPNGWGTGAAPDWPSLVNLKFNDAASAAFGKMSLGVGDPLLLVFGGASVNDMLKNWAIHVQKLSLPYAVACMDEALYTLANQHNIPGVMMVEKDTAGEKEVTTRWKYFRMDPAAFMTMGILKVRFFIEFMAAGFDVLCADLDVVWLKDPRPWISGVADPSAMLLPYPDIIVSTDVTHGGADTDARKWGMAEEMNTGMLLLRSSPGAVATCMAWVDRMRLEMVSSK